MFRWSCQSNQRRAAPYELMPALISYQMGCGRHSFAAPKFRRKEIQLKRRDDMRKISLRRCDRKKICSQKEQGVLTMSAGRLPFRLTSRCLCSWMAERKNLWFLLQNQFSYILSAYSFSCMFAYNYTALFFFDFYFYL